MRLSGQAPVDTMGCEKAGSLLPPKVVFVSKSSFDQKTQCIVVVIFDQSKGYFHLNT